MALQLPFQATSLPALVIKIVTQPPNFSILTSSYSNAIIELVCYRFLFIIIINIII